jgi:serine/threonine protein kinase
LIQGVEELRPLPETIAARICADACAGLHAAHEAAGPDGAFLGVVHRDVSPPNILVSVHGQVKVSDFGIAKAANQLHARTRTGAIKGKLAYIPPEQVLGQGLDRRADVYAMGVVLYVTTLGHRPFGSGAKALGKIVRGTYRKPRELRVDYPEGLEAIIVKALQKDQSARFQTAEEMRFALEQWLLTSSKPVSAGDVGRVVRERLTPQRRKMIDALMSTSRTLPEALANRFLSPQPTDKTVTPTATSGVVVQAAGLAKKAPLKSEVVPKASRASKSELDVGKVEIKPAKPAKPAPKAKAKSPDDEATLIGMAQASGSLARMPVPVGSDASPTEKPPPGEPAAGAGASRATPGSKAIADPTPMPSFRPRWHAWLPLGLVLVASLAFAVYDYLR